jgi:hypothetical protein
MILVKDSYFAKILKVDGIVLYPFVFFSAANPNQILINHEMIHVEQIKECGVVKFYMSYLWQYISFRFKGSGHYQAYMSISFEKEAYKNQTKDLSRS